MAYGKCGMCKNCRTESTYSWCDYYGKEVFPNQSVDCQGFSDIRYYISNNNSNIHIDIIWP